VPRDSGGGFQGAYNELPDDTVVETMDNNQKKWIRPTNGTELIEYRYHAGLVHLDNQRLPYIIPFKSTGHTVSKNWMSALRKPFPDGSGRSRSYHSKYLLTTVHRTNKKGQWFQFKIEDRGWIDRPADLAMAYNFQQLLLSGQRQADMPLLEHHDEEE